MAPADIQTQLQERIVNLNVALMERDQRILALERELKAKEHYIPPPPRGTTTSQAALEIMEGMAQSLRNKVLEERIKTLEAENEEYKDKAAYVAPSDDESDDIHSEDTATVLATELSMANNALMNAQDEITALGNEVERLVAQRDEEITALIEENEEIINSGPYERVERLNVLSKTAAEIIPEPTIDIINDHTCIICLDKANGPFIRTNKCNFDHGVCFKCFVHLTNGPSKAQCPICMTKWEEGNLLIE